MRSIVRVFRRLSGAGAVANARRACQELAARRQYADEVAAQLMQRLATADPALRASRRPA